MTILRKVKAKLFDEMEKSYWGGTAIACVNFFQGYITEEFLRADPI